MILRISLFVAAALLLGAHFLRAGNLGLVALCLATPLLFCHRRRWSLFLLQFVAYCAAASWVGAAIQLVGLRRLSGRPWLLAAAILGAVALFTFLAGLLLNSRAITDRYPD